MTDPRRAHLAVLTDVSEAVARLTSPAEIISALGVRLRTHLRLDACVFAAVSAGGGMTVTHRWPEVRAESPAELPSRRVVSAGHLAVCRRGDTAVAADAQQAQGAATISEGELEFAAYVAVPHGADGACRNVLVFASLQPRDWTADEVWACGEIARWTLPRIVPLAPATESKTGPEDDAARRETERRQRLLVEAALRASEGQFRSVLEAMSEGLMLFDPSGNLIYQNPASLRIHGFAPGEVQLPSEQVPVTWKAWDETGRPITFEEWPVSRVFRRERFQDQILRVVRVETGQEFFGSYNGSPILGSDGALLLGFITIRDITAQMRAMAALRESEHLFHALADVMPQLVWTTDPGGLVTYVNRRWLEYTGQIPEAASGQGWLSVVHPEDLTRVLEHAQASAVTGEPYEVEYRLRAASGDYRWFLARAAAQRDVEGRVMQWFGTSTDIDDQKRTLRALQESQAALLNAQAELHRANADLEQNVSERTARLRETVAELEHFSYTITHDMRAPLRAMQSFAELLRDEYRTRLDEAAADYLRRIIDAAARMDALITDSLNYAKAVQTELRLSPIDPGALIRGIVESYPKFQPPHALIDVAPSFPAAIANAAGLTQCVSNLIDNAVKFVAAGTTPRIRIWGEERIDGIRLWFEDNGIGIPVEQQDRVFIMFQRLSKQYDGTGVGLALVRKVAAKMRGRVGVESNPAGGSRFWLELQPIPRSSGTAAQRP